jgi:tetratricopeptide (TPR) repeat protein
MAVDERLEDAAALYERALFVGDGAALTLAAARLDALEAELEVARGRLLHARYLEVRRRDQTAAVEDPRELERFEHALELSRRLHDPCGEAVALFWIGCVHQVLRRDNPAASPCFARSLELATGCGDEATMSDALRHLGIAKHAAGDLDDARSLLEASNRLREEGGNLVGVASNMVGLIYIARAEGRDHDAEDLARRSTSIASRLHASVILEQVAEAMGS